MFNKKVIGTIIGGLLAAGTLPVVPQDMELLFSYSRPCVIQESGATTTTPSPDEYQPTQCSPDGNAYISVFKDSNGNRVFVEIPLERYKLMGGEDGFKFNPTKNEYQTLFKAFVWEADALSVTGSTGATSGGAASSLTYSHTTVSGDNLVVVEIGADTVTSITFNGAAFTEAISTVTTFRSGIWYKISPFIGTANVVVNQSSTWAITSGATNYSGADTTSPIGVTAVAEASEDVTLNNTTAGNIITAVARNANSATTLSFGAGQTQRWNQNSAGTGQNRSGGSTKAAGGNITMDQTFSLNDNPSAAGAEIKAAAAAAVPQKPTPILEFNYFYDAKTPLF